MFRLLYWTLLENSFRHWYWGLKSENRINKKAAMCDISSNTDIQHKRATFIQNECYIRVLQFNPFENLFLGFSFWWPDPYTNVYFHWLVALKLDLILLNEIKNKNWYCIAWWISTQVKKYGQSNSQKYFHPFRRQVFIDIFNINSVSKRKPHT